MKMGGGSGAPASFESPAFYVKVAYMVDHLLEKDYK